jgi:dTDP-glucose 4,6-dehydratase
MKILITGGAGFIGSETARQLVNLGHQVTILDWLTYAGHLKSLNGIKKQVDFSKIDIRDVENLSDFFSEHTFDSVINFAAETHVDNSISDPRVFIETNTVGAFNILEECRKHNFRLLHVSTDEVYGSIPDGLYPETSRFSPSSPYSASKASAEMFVNAYIQTFKLDIVGVRCSNNYGQFQNSEKLIPTLIKKTMLREKLPIYGDGSNVREWIHVSDSSRAIIEVLLKGISGQFYNVSSGEFKKNLDVAKLVLDYFSLDYSQISFVGDRLGHDFRYAIDSRKIKEELNWEPEIGFEEGLRATIEWYIANPNWEEEIEIQKW